MKLSHRLCCFIYGCSCILCVDFFRALFGILCIKFSRLYPGWTIFKAIPGWMIFKAIPGWTIFKAIFPGELHWPVVHLQILVMMLTSLFVTVIVVNMWTGLAFKFCHCVKWMLISDFNICNCADICTFLFNPLMLLWFIFGCVVFFVQSSLKEFHCSVLKVTSCRSCAVSDDDDH